MDWFLMLDSLPQLVGATVVTIELLSLTLVLGGMLALPLGVAVADGSFPG